MGLYDGYTLSVCCSVSWFCLIARLQLPLDQLTGLIKFYHLIAWGLPVSLAGIAYSMSWVENGGPVYTRNVMNCWIGERYKAYRLIFFYLPLWLSFLYTMGVYAFIGRHIFKAEKEQKRRGEVPLLHNATKRFVAKTIIYLIIFIACWIWGSIGRIYEMVNHGEMSYVLVLLHMVSWQQSLTVVVVCSS